MTNLNPTNTPLKWRLVAGVSWAAFVLVLAHLIYRLGWSEHLLNLVRTFNDPLAIWIESFGLVAYSLTVLSTLALMGIYCIGVNKFKLPKPPSISTHLHKNFGNPQPANTYPLEALAGELYPNTSTAPELLGREAELELLTEQYKQTTPNALRVVSVWGQQGIGKTHLLYAFGKKLQHNAQKVLGQNRTTWRVWVLEREFEAQALLDSLPTQPCLLLWDDISLSDEGTKTRLATLRQLCTQRAQPLLIVLTTWSAQSGLTANDRGVDAELLCPSLDSASAQRLYADVESLPPAYQGHPLLLRLLQEAGGSKVSISDNNLQAELWRLCLNRADALIKRYRDEHTASDDALCAIAVASSGDDLPLADVAQDFGLAASTLQKTLKQLSLCTERQGLLLLAPLPLVDLIGWAFAHQVLQAVPAQRLQTWAALVWSYVFFDTGRFLVYAQQADFPRHPWVQALHSGVGLSAPAVLNRAKAAVNATNAYGSAQRWDEAQAEVAVCQELAQKHPDHAEIQLRRAQAAANAIYHYGSAKMWDEMQAQLVVCQDLAQNHPDHAEIQLIRAQVAANAIYHYGRAQMLPAMQAELVVCQKIAERFPDNAEIQLARATAAANAISDYGSAQMWSAMQAELAVCQDLAQKHPDNAEIQLRRAQAAFNATNAYGSVQRWDEVQAEVAVFQKIAERFPDHAEIQKRRAELNAWLNEHQKGKHPA